MFLQKYRIMLKQVSTTASTNDGLKRRTIVVKFLFILEDPAAIDQSLGVRRDRNGFCDVFFESAYCNLLRRK